MHDQLPVVSRYSGQVETVQVTRPLGGTTRDKVIEAAARHGWSLEHGYQNSLLQGENPTGALAFRNRASRVTLELGGKGQIIWGCSHHGLILGRGRYEQVLAILKAA